MSYSIKAAAIGLAAATGLTCSYVEPAKADGLGDTTFVVNTKAGRLNVRQKPSTSSKVVGKLQKGSKVVVTDLCKDKWGKVDNGWVSMDYLKILRNTAVLEHEAQIDKELQEMNVLYKDESTQHKRWLKRGRPATEHVIECDDTVTFYSHGTNVSRPLFKAKDGTKIEVYYALVTSDYAFASVENSKGEKVYGYLCWYNISANK